MANSCVRAGTTQAFSAWTKAPMRGREDEDMRAAAERQHQRELRSVDEEAGGKLPVPRLQKGGGRIVHPARQLREEREDRADRDIGVDVRRAVERVDGERQRRSASSSTGSPVPRKRRARPARGAPRRGRSRRHRCRGPVCRSPSALVPRARPANGRAERALIDGVADLEGRAGNGAHDLARSRCAAASAPR